MLIVNALIYLVFGIFVLIMTILENKKIGVKDLKLMSRSRFLRAGMTSSPKKGIF